MASGNKTIVKNTIFLYIRMVVVLAISLYTTRAVLAALGVEDFGIYNVVGGFVSMFAFISTMMSNATLRFYNYKLGKDGEEATKAVYNISVILQVLFFLCILVLLETIGIWYVNKKMVMDPGRLQTANWLLQFSILSLGFSMINVPHNAAILAHEKMSFFAIVSIIDACLKLGIVFVVQYLQGDKLFYYGMLMVIISIVSFLLNFIYCRINYSCLRINLKVEKSLFKEMFAFFGWNTFGAFSNIMKEQGLNLILNFFFGPIVNAARGVTSQVTSALQQFVSNNNVAVTPQMVKSYAAGDVERSIKLFFTVSKLNFVLFAMLAIPLGCEIDYVLNLWLGGNVPSYTPIFTILVFFCTIVNNWNAPLSNLVYATGKMRDYQLAGMINLLSLPIIFMAFKLSADPYWAFVIVFFVSLVNHCVGLIIVKRIVDFSLSKYFVDIMVKSTVVLLISSILPILCVSLLPSSFGRLVMTVVIAVLSMVPAAYFIMLNKEERLMVKNIVLNKLRKK